MDGIFGTPIRIFEAKTKLWYPDTLDVGRVSVILLRVAVSWRPLRHPPTACVGRRSGSPLRDLNKAFKNADPDTENVGRLSPILIRGLPPYANFARYSRWYLQKIVVH